MFTVQSMKRTHPFNNKYNLINTYHGGQAKSIIIVYCHRIIQNISFNTNNITKIQFCIGFISQKDI